MNIHISDEAVNWFKDEMDLVEGDVVRFFPKYGGTSDFQDGFSIGLEPGRADVAGVEEEKQNIIFQIDEKDEWFFKEQDLYIDIKEGELVFSNESIE
ncbi:adhesin [Filobacillus milosensis]|uniref:Adhesin n=1 Tax=Filobacillus milosensis TaxID=94137 RepID=A0A4Y8IFE9_9BACI|nr:adhesin [Filobacillus milosensis]TFB18883.1 adhesin [Filobacillus milosensis]